MVSIRLKKLFAYEPGVWQGPINVQLEATGPAVDGFLQCPSTASSGRKLITTSRGDSYIFRFAESLGSSVIRIALPPCSSLMGLPSTATTSRA